ncbi:MAG: hypothetical protein ACOCRC_02630 [Halodesulfurarchaeum sp.]
MSEVPEAVDLVDNTFYRRGMVVAVLYGIVDALILFVPGPWVLFRLIGAVVAYYAARDIVALREVGLHWGKTRYLLLLFVGIGGFLGYFFYAWRRMGHLSRASVDAETGRIVAEGEDETDEAAADSDSDPDT